jgi:hypothetical protein
LEDPRLRTPTTEGSQSPVLLFLSFDHEPLLVWISLARTVDCIATFSKPIMIVAFFLATGILPQLVAGLTTGFRDGVQNVLTEAIDTQFKCDLPPLIEPSGDGLPAARDVFSGEESLKLQVERHSAIVKIPSISYDDNGDPLEDPRWDIFYTLHDTLESLYPNV